MAQSMAKARSLCTKSEIELVAASSPKNLSKLSAARLRQKVAQARKLRDKWLDQAQQQRRAKQAAQQARGTSSAVRSEQKAELFAEVLDRFEKRLQKVDGAGGSASGTKPKRQNPPRKVRAAEHRDKRAAVRKALQAEQEEIDRGRAASPEAPAATSDAQPATEKPAAKKVAKKVAKKAVGRKKAVKKARKAVVARRKKASSVEAAAPKPAAVKKKTRPARTAAKQARVVQSGAVRVQKHVSARGRRNQARRDSRR